MSLWFLFQRGGSNEISDPLPSQAAPAPADGPSIRAAAPKAEAIAAPKAEPIAAPSSEPKALEATAVAPSAAAELTPPPPAAGKVSVVVRLEPPDAKLYYRGKAVGSSGVILSLDAGKRRAFEVGKPGYITRKLVVDGSTPEVSLGLRPDPNATP